MRDLKRGRDHAGVLAQKLLKVQTRDRTAAEGSQVSRGELTVDYSDIRA
jgi:hypothetical protein